MALDVKKHVDITASTQDFAPILIREIELSQPFPVFSAFDEQKKLTYQSVRCLVRLHTQPLDLIELKFQKDELKPDEYVQEIWHALQAKINEHLQRDGLPAITELTTNGLPVSSLPPCIEERQQFLKDAPFASVIVSTHERPDTLAPCLRSLLALDYPQYEIIVVDNAPRTTATFDLVQKLSQGVSHLRYTREDLSGLSWARNKGVELARGEILAFTDDDVVVDPYWLAYIAKGFRTTKNVACVTGSILPLELDTEAQMLFEQFGGMFRGFDWRIFDLKENRPEWPSFPYTAWHCGAGASMAFTAEFLASVGGFDPALGGPGPVKNSQDMAAFFQVLARGHQLVYEPASLLYHLHRRDHIRLRNQIYSYGLGFVAHVTKGLVENPQFIPDFMGRLFLSFFSHFKPAKPEQRKEKKDDSRELSKLAWEWRKGALYGPVAYFQTRRRVRQVLRSLDASARSSKSSAPVMNDHSALGGAK